MPSIVIDCVNELDGELEGALKDHGSLNGATKQPEKTEPRFLRSAAFDAARRIAESLGERIRFLR